MADPHRSDPGTEAGCMLPDFVIIGAQKAGTSRVYTWLRGHTHVRASETKEIRYFTHHFHRGTDWYRHHFPPERDRASFAAEHGRPFITGEATPAYLLEPRAPERMARLIPDAKLIVQLRNPVDRAYSHFQMNRRLGWEPIGSFRAALGLEDRRFAANWGYSPAAPDGFGARSWTQYLGRGRYAEQLERWFDHFPIEHFHVLTVDALAANPHETLDQLLAFLGLPRRREDFRRFDEPPEPVPNHSYAPMPEETRTGLREYFQPHNQRLYELLGQDFGWEQ